MMEQQKSMELHQYLLSNSVSLKSEEFVPLNAVAVVLDSTCNTIKQRIEDGTLSGKHFFSSKTDQSWFGVQAGSVKKALLAINGKRTAVRDAIDKLIQSGDWETYTNIMINSGMNPKHPPDRKLINTILKDINRASVGSGLPYLKGSVVVSVNNGIPTQSFFDLAVELCLFPASQQYNMSEKRLFWQKNFDAIKKERQL
jgi:hypothetical protein